MNKQTDFFMINILDNYIFASLIVFVLQLIFIYLKTINIIYTSDRKMFMSIITSNGLSLVFFLLLAIGANSVIKGDFIVLFSYMAGGTLGTYIGIKQAIRGDKNG